MASHAAKCARLTAHAHTAGLGASWRFSLGRRPKRPEKGAMKPPAAPCPSLLSQPPRFPCQIGPTATARCQELQGCLECKSPNWSHEQAPQGLTCLNHLAQDLLPSLVCQRATWNSKWGACMFISISSQYINEKERKKLR